MCAATSAARVRLGQQQLGGIDAGELVGQRLDADVEHRRLAGRDIGPGEREIGLAVPQHRERREIVADAARRQQIVLGEGAAR